MKKRILLFFALLCCSNSLFAQREVILEPKINVASLAVGILNPALEIGFGNKSAVELSYVGAYAKSNFMGSGEPLMLCVFMAEYRYYWLNEHHKGFFTGGHFGGDMFKTNKCILPAIGYEGKGRSYDWGQGLMLGVTVGYKFLFKERFGLELSLSGGWHYAWHEPHSYMSDSNYDDIDIYSVMDINRTAEWLPYKAGAYFSYRF